MSNALLSTIFSIPVRVYYEDTDMGGVVYYANYLKFAERARSDWLRHSGIENSKLHRDHGVFFVVSTCHIDYKMPAKMDDALTVTVENIIVGRTSMDMTQNIFKDGDQLCAVVQVKIVMVNEAGKPTRIIKEILDKI